MASFLRDTKVQRQLARAIAVGGAVRALHGDFKLDQKLALDIALALAVDLGLDAAFASMPASSQQQILEAGGASTAAAEAATTTTTATTTTEVQADSSSTEPELGEPRPPIRFRRL